jgi:recombinational DNA repair protein RecR
LLFWAYSLYGEIAKWGQLEMALKNCKECGRLYLENASGLCPDCFRQHKQDEEAVLDFLQTQSKATLEEICAVTGVQHENILRMLRYGQISEIFDVSYPCQLCGGLIQRNNVCDSCSNRIIPPVSCKSKKATQPVISKKKRKKYAQKMLIK